MTTRTIWKHGFMITDVPQTVHMPKDAVVVHVREDQNSPESVPALAMWFLCDAQAESEWRMFLVSPTNGVIDGNYVGSAYLRDDMWHLFEIV